MTNVFRRFSVLLLIAASLLAANSVSAAPLAIESARSHSAAGVNGCTVSGATAATPSVITCSAAHHLIDGDQVQITGIGGTTTDNTTGYAKVTGYSTTTFGLYSDAALSTGVTGTGSYTSGGAVSEAADISALSGDFTVRLIFNSLTAAKNSAVCIQDSADGFVSDIVTLACANVAGGIGTANNGLSGNPAGGVTYTWRKYQLPSLRAGVTSGRLRLNVTQIDGSATAVLSLFFEQ